MDFEALRDKTKKLTVLFIEDDESFKDETTDIFNMLFYEVITQSDGKKGLDKYKNFFDKKQKYPDIVISDINMPNLNGIELTKEIYKINPNQKIIIISAYNDSDNLIELINIGVDKFILKPFNIDNLFEVLNNIITSTREPIEEKDSNTIELKDGYRWDKELEILYNKNKNIVKLSKKELALLKLLIKNLNKTITHTQIENKIWEDDPYGISESAKKSLILRLRKKLPNNSLQSLSKIGYKLTIQ